MFYTNSNDKPFQLSSFEQRFKFYNLLRVDKNDEDSNTYMEQFCKALHPNLELGTVCVAWFRQATKHCSEILSGVRSPSGYFWTTVRNFIFPDRNTHIMSQKMPINVHPDRLSMQDCQSLFLDMVRDYVQGAPRYAAESATNSMLWQVLYSLMGIMALGSLLLGIIFTYNKYGQPSQKINVLEEFFKPEEHMDTIDKRSIHFTKAEIRNIRIKPVAKEDNIVAADDDAEVLALKVSNKYEFLETVVEGSMTAEGKLCRLYDQYNKTKHDFKIEALNKAMKFLDNDCQKLHLLLMFEDDVPVEEARKCKSTSPKIRSLSPPAKLSPRIPSLSAKGILCNRLEGGSIINKAVGTGTSSNSPRSSSPKQAKTPTSESRPRCSGVASSSIPRNLPKRPALIRKSK